MQSPRSADQLPAERAAFLPRRSVARAVVVLLVVALAAAAGAGAVPAAAQTVTEIQVTDDPAHQFDPAVSQGRVAYTDFRNGDADIYVYDIDTAQEVQIGTAGTHQVLQDIDGDFVVFTDFRNGDGDIYAYDLATGIETQLTDDPADQQNPAISGNQVVWEDFSTGSSTPNVFLGSLDGSPASAVSAVAAPQLSPAISGDLVAWEDLRNAGAGGSFDVFAYDLTNGVEIAVATGSSTARRPDIDGRRIVYQDDAAGNLDIYLYDADAGTTQQLTTLASTQQNPHISGDRVVWEDDRNGSCTPASNPDCNWDLYGLDLTTLTEYAVATGPQKQFLHDVDGFDVAFTDDRHGNQDIFVKRTLEDTTPPPATLTLSPVTDTNPVGTDHTVTATVQDVLSNQVPEVIVRFSVTGSVTTSGDCTTDASGQCDFTYTGPTTPGADLISAYADTDGDGVQDAGEPSGEATKAWELPASTAGQASGGGHFADAAWGKVVFGFVAKSKDGAFHGQCNVIDPGNRMIKCLDVTALAISGNQATIYGNATDEGVATTYVIQVVDNADPGKGADTFSITTASGFSASGTLTAGNIQVKP